MYSRTSIDLSQKTRAEMEHLNGVKKYLTSRKAVMKVLNNLKQMETKFITSCFDNGIDDGDVISMLRQVEEVTIRVVKSFLSFISGSEAESKSSRCSLVSKLIQNKRVGSEEGRKTMKLQRPKMHCTPSLNLAIPSTLSTLPSRQHPIASQIDENLNRLRAPQSASTSSSVGDKLNCLQDLYDYVDMFLQLPLSQQDLAQEPQRKLVDEPLDGSLLLLDVCGTAKDALQQTKASQAESLLSFISGPEAESLLSFISGPEAELKSSRWSLVSKLIHQKRVMCEEAEQKTKEIANAEAALRSFIKSGNMKHVESVQNELQNTEMCIQDLEEGLESFFRRLIKARVTVLNILNQTMALVWHVTSIRAMLSSLPLVLTLASPRPGQNPPSSYCQPNPAYPCAPAGQYFGKGPMQLSWNYNNGQCGRAIGVDLLHNPDLLETDATICFKSAFWFWMAAQPPKPSCHNVIVGAWQWLGCTGAGPDWVQ
ncbi:putative Eukaryotic translation initiation factor 3 subunit A [Hibiscus syriacus]|uniref:Eukaryotic translation initiation factor 3 subunit A n=1 Tax=Hibiscus syriacus TaxID=106335 RepID=A0A6A2ZG80_HIBSY|nr:putative Eukaryotic translation initiation factor 3 subunit A [Hibiscus syriacus]